MSLCQQCVTGFRHEGVPTGKIEKLAGVEVYITLPEGQYDKEKAVLYLPDALGLPFVNGKLLADEYARNGFQVYMVDLLNGEPFPIDGINLDNQINPDNKYDVEGWIKRHDVQSTRLSLDAVISALKERGVKYFGATGYCFGGRYAFHLAQENIVKVAVATHPSLLEIPGDLEKLLAESRAPMLINTCDVDKLFPIESCVIADKLLGDGKYSPGYKRAHWDGCMHGFAVRGDLSDPKIKAGKEGALMEAAVWLKKYL